MGINGHSCSSYLVCFLPGSGLGGSTLAITLGGVTSLGGSALGITLGGSGLGGSTLAESLFSSKFSIFLVFSSYLCEK